MIDYYCHSYNALDWQDKRKKPSFEAVKSAFNTNYKVDAKGNITSKIVDEA
jgi:hypothetical protein